MMRFISLFSLFLFAGRMYGEEISLYELKAQLTDQNGQVISLSHYQGHPVLISMFYTQCSFICPALVSKIKSVESQLKPDELEKLRVLLISFDPERDTAAVLKEKAESLELDGKRWILAQTSEDQVREIAALLGIVYRRLPNGDYNHSTIITLLNPHGVPVSRLEELRSNVEPLVQVFRTLL